MDLGAMCHVVKATRCGTCCGEQERQQEQASASSDARDARHSDCAAPLASERLRIYLHVALREL
jgi:hypothetical protein